MENVNSYQKIVSVFSDIQVAHPNLKSFFEGVIEQDSVKYPALKINLNLDDSILPINDQFYFNSIVYVIEVEVIDQLLPDESNRTSVKSDTLKVLIDVINNLTQNPDFYFAFRIIEDVKFGQKIRTLPDNTYATTTKIKIETFNNNYFDGLPSE